MRTKIKNLKTQDLSLFINREVTIKGWVRTIRRQKTLMFIEINDGSTLSNFQVIMTEDLPNYQTILAQVSTGASISATGIIVMSPGTKQTLEMQASAVTLIGASDPEHYPLQKKRHTFEFLRTIGHLRGRTNTLGAVMRVRNALAVATHQFFQQRGFLYLQTPILTSSDCEGAGKLFRVTNFDLNRLPTTSEGIVDNSQDFFGKPVYLTVSGQLNGEIYASALSDIYTFGPTFRAEYSNTSRHLAEFWMVEPEMAFADLQDDMDCAEAYLKEVVQYTLENCQEDMLFFNQYIAPGLLERLQHIIQTPFARTTYTDAIQILEKSNKQFEFPVKWGLDLQSEHERYLAEEFFNGPVIIRDYPKQIKAFYMRANDDGRTVAAMDVLVPKIGEIVGGSQREERLDRLEIKLKEVGLSPDDYWWYLELRKYGSVPHAGFGAGFERLVQFITEMENIRDVIPFPRYPGSVEF